jgi:hypothetical protein
MRMLIKQVGQFCMQIHNNTRGTVVTRLFEADGSLRKIAIHMGWLVDYASPLIGVYAALNPDTANRILLKLYGKL